MVLSTIYAKEVDLTFLIFAYGLHIFISCGPTIFRKACNYYLPFGYNVVNFIFIKKKKLLLYYNKLIKKDKIDINLDI